MTRVCSPLTLFTALLAAAPAAADDPASIFRFKEYAHPIFPVANNRYTAAYAFSADGKLLALAGEDQIVVLNSETGKRVTDIQLPRKQTAVRLVFAADGKTLASDGTDDAAIRFWDLKTGKQARELEYPQVRPLPRNHPESPPVLAFGPGAAKFVTYGGDAGSLRVHNAATGKVLAELEGTSDPRRAVFSPDGSLVAYSSNSGGLALLDARTGKKVRDLIPGNPPGGRTNSFATFSPDGRYVADGEPDQPGETRLRHLTVWRVADGKRCARVFTEEGFTSAAFSKGGRTLAAAGSPYGLYLYDLATDTLYLWAKLPRPYGVAVVGCPDGSTLAVVAPASKGGGQSVYVMPFPEYDDSFGPTGPTARKLADCWEGVVGDNEFRKDHEIERLRSAPEQAVAFARGKVKPVPDLYRRRAADLVENLGSPTSTTRWPRASSSSPTSSSRCWRTRSRRRPRATPATVWRRSSSERRRPRRRPG
jgi:WD40 repeat protein